MRQKNPLPLIATEETGDINFVQCIMLAEISSNHPFPSGSYLCQ